MQDWYFTQKILTWYTLFHFMISIIFIIIVIYFLLLPIGPNPGNSDSWKIEKELSILSNFKIWFPYLDNIDTTQRTSVSSTSWSCQPTLNQKMLIIGIISNFPKYLHQCSEHGTCVCKDSASCCLRIHHPSCSPDRCCSCSQDPCRRCCLGTEKIQQKRRKLTSMTTFLLSSSSRPQWWCPGCWGHSAFPGFSSSAAECTCPPARSSAEDVSQEFWWWACSVGRLWASYQLEVELGEVRQRMFAP